MILHGLITSRTKVRILVRLFLNPQGSAYLRELAQEFDVSPSQVKHELANLEQSGLLVSDRQGRQIHYRANTRHALFPELNSMVRKALGMDRILDSIVERLGDLELAILLDDYAEGRDSGIIDLLLVGNIDPANLADLVFKTERYIGRKIRTLRMERDEFEQFVPQLECRPQLLLWQRKG